MLIEVIGLLAAASIASANTYTLEVTKKLLNGEKLSSPSTFTFSNDEAADKMKIDFNVDLPFAVKEVTSTSVYFANLQKEILQVDFTKGSVTLSKHETPYKITDVHSVEESEANPTKFTYDFDMGMLPAHTIAVSASISVIDDTDNKVILNYYGIKNYPISIEDTLVVESFMRANFEPKP